MDSPHTPSPPPPPAVQYVYPPPPRRGFLGGFIRFIGWLLVLAVVFAIGSESSMFGLRMGNLALPSAYRAGEGSDVIAIVTINGIIDEPMVDYVHRVVESVIADKSIKAVVLRVESPGGGASASDQILHELNRIRSEKGIPIIASYGGYAASGGYYVSCQADRIFAEPTCVTGSIGVISQIPTFQKLLEEKLGVKVETITATGAPQKETANTYYRSWTDADRAEMRKLIDAIHGRFIEVVAEGRKGVLKRERVAELSNGLAYTAAEAKTSGLIDEIGYLDAALAYATQQGSFSTSHPPVVYYRPPNTLLDLFGFEHKTGGGSASRLDDMGRLISGAQAKRWLSELAVPEVVMMFNP